MAQKIRLAFGASSAVYLQLNRHFIAEVTYGPVFSLATATIGDKFAAQICAIADCALTLHNERADSGRCIGRPAEAIRKDYMSRYTTRSAQTKLAAVTAGLGAAALGGVGLGMLTAPSATASPAPSSVEADYISLLDANGAHIYGQDADELKLGYLLCALSQRNGLPPAGAAAYMTAARNSKLCYYVSTTGGPTGAQVQQGLDAWQQQQNAPGIDAWNNIDSDHDGISDANDNAEFDPNHY